MEDSNPYLSRFSEDTWRNFVETRRPKQVVCDLHDPPEDGPLWHCDVRSCRFHALTEASVAEIPVFSPMDVITEVAPGSTVLSDYNWIDIPPGQLRSDLQTFVYDGPRFYDRASCQFMLEHRIATWSCVSLALQATSHRPATELANQLRYMKEIWRTVGDSYAGECWSNDRKKNAKELLAKAATLALIGLWGRVQNYKYVTVTSDHQDDCSFDGEVDVSRAPGSDTVHDITYRQTVLGYSTFLPLSLIARSMERLNVARGIMILLKHMRAERLICIQVDAIVFKPHRKTARVACEELEEVTYHTLHAATRLQLTTYVAPLLQDPIRSTEKVFQLKQLSEVPKVGGSLTRGTCERPVPWMATWNVQTEPLTGPDTFAELIKTHMLKHSGSVQGSPGCGKSRLTTQLRQHLRALLLYTSPSPRD